MGAVLACRPTFSMHIAHVVGMRSEEEMIVVYTGWRIALMKHVLSASQSSAVRSLPSDAMRQPDALVDPELPISRTVE